MKTEKLSDTITIINADCRAVLSVEYDVVVTDPPYGIDLDTDFSTLRGTPEFNRKHGNYSGKTHQRVFGDNEQFNPEPWLDKPCVFFGADHYASRLPQGGTWHVWDKREELGSNMLADFETVWTSGMSGPSRIIRHKWLGYMRKSEVGDHFHPTQKPIAVVSWCMDKARVASGAIVLDPYMGSGTTGIACIRTGRRFIGIEIDEQHYQTARRRLLNELAQTNLFRQDEDARAGQGECPGTACNSASMQNAQVELDLL